MSKVAIQGNASGTGTFTIAAPNSNTDRTLTLPDEAGTVLTSGAVASSIPGYGNQITEIQQWRLNNTHTVGSTESFLTAWEVVDNSFYQTIGTGLSLSGSVFSFPSTGIYQIIFHGRIHYNNAAQTYLFMELEVTTNNDFSSTATGIVAPIQGGYTSDSYGSISGSAVLKISDVSNEKFRFRVRSQSTNTNLQGSTSQSQTAFTVLKLGDI